MFLIDTNKKEATSLEKKTFSELNLSERYDLQEWIAKNPFILGENLLIIQKEFDGFSDTNERLDLLALDESGKLVVIENKLDDSGRDVVWQALKYVSYCATLTKNEIKDIYQKYLGATVEDASKRISEFFNDQDFESIRLNAQDSDQRIILVAANYRKEVTSTVLWLCDHGVDIKCIKVTPYKDDGKLYLDAEQILPIQDTGDYQIRLAAKRQEDAISSIVESDYHKQLNRFWEKALPLVKAQTGMFSSVFPSETEWIHAASSINGIVFNAVVVKYSARVELWINTNDVARRKNLYLALIDKKDEIESIFGEKLDWQEPSYGKRGKVMYHYEHGVDDEDNWNDIISFFAEKLVKLVSAFEPVFNTALKSI